MGNVADKEELHEAAKAGDAEKVEACIEKHAGQNGALDVLDERYGNTALMWAVRKGHHDRAGIDQGEGFRGHAE